MTMSLAPPKPQQPARRHTHEEFDLELFLSLNEEWKNKPVEPRPTSGGTTAASRSHWARSQAEILDARLHLRGKTVLEIGCGRGDLAYVLAAEYQCTVVGVDVKEYPNWSDYQHPHLSLTVADLSQSHDLQPGSFERIISQVVWEHVEHPFALLKAAYELLAEDGAFYLRANLYRSANASHRYREVFFPWPHLLFQDSVFRQFYEQLGQNPRGSAWVNKLTYAQYRHYFDRLGYIVTKENFTRRPLDQKFYERFEDLLGRYPISDLTLDFFAVTLKKQDSSDGDDPPGKNYQDALRKFRQQVADRLPVGSEADALTQEKILQILDQPVYRCLKAGSNLRWSQWKHFARRGARKLLSFVR